MNKLCLGFILFMVCGCNNREGIKDNSLDIESVLLSDREIPLSDLCDSLSYIPLQTTDASLLGGNAYVLYSDQTDIFISSDNYIYRFDTNGYFKNKIGQKGNGPGEYSILYSKIVDPNKQYLIYYLGNKKVQLWGYDGTFLNEFSLDIDGEITSLCMLEGKFFVCEKRQYTKKGFNSSICILNLKGKLLKSYNIQNDTETVKRDMYTVPIVYSYMDGIVKYKGLYDSDLYICQKDTCIKEWELFLGKFFPDREHVENMNMRKSLHDEFAQLVDIKESENYFYLLIVHAYSLRGIVFSKKDRNMIFNQVINMPQRGGGIRNDDIGNFWPSFVNGKVLYALLPVHSLSNSQRRNIQKACHSKIKIEQDSNPVIIRCVESHVKG